MRYLFKQCGFSLLEILIAVGILAGAVATVMPQVNVAAMLSVKDNEMLQAVLLANNKMVELEQEINDDMKRGKFPDETTKSGGFDDPFDNYSWEYSIKKVEIPVVDAGSEGQSAVAGSLLKNIMKDISKAVREIKLTVRWGEADNEEDLEKYTLTTHMVNIK